MKRSLFVITALALSFNASAKTLTIGFDLSGSNLLLSHENFAYSASQYVSNEINKLKSGDRVQIKTFGARSQATNLVTHTLVISRKNKADKVAQLVGNFIRNLPKHDNIQQSSTNLIAWLEFTDGFNCEQEGEILVVTDGLESSSYLSGKEFIEGKKTLPKADVDLNGCNLTRLKPFVMPGANGPLRLARVSKRSFLNEIRRKFN